jgi:hypothetical protein
MAERGSVEGWRLDRYKAGDETLLLELFRAVFGKTRSPEHWKWQFRDNPYGGPFVSLARAADGGHLAGAYSVMPIQLNYLGRAIPGCQSVDTAVHPAFRGQRIFEKTASDCYEWCASSGIQAVEGFPNANSYPGFVRNLAWKRIVFPRQYTLRLSVVAALRRAIGVSWIAASLNAPFSAWARTRIALREGALRRLEARNTTFRVFHAVPEGYEALWDRWRVQEVLSIWKDSKYFRWRYDQNPDHEFQYFTLSAETGILALAVGLELDGALVLCELMVGQHDVIAGRLLISHIARYSISHRLRAVTFLGHDSGLFAEVLQGFQSVVSHTNVFGGRSFVSAPLSEDLPHADNWTVTFGDGDFV